MINVIVKETRTNSSGHIETHLTVKGHKDGAKASVFNGVLTIFNAAATSNDFVNAVAGYEPSAWVSWEKA